MSGLLDYWWCKGDGTGIESRTALGWLTCDGADSRRFDNDGIILCCDVFGTNNMVLDTLFLDSCTRLCLCLLYTSPSPRD